MSDILEELAREIMGNLTILIDGADRVETLITRDSTIYMAGIGLMILVLFIQLGISIYICRKKKEHSLAVRPNDEGDSPIFKDQYSPI